MTRFRHYLRHETWCPETLIGPSDVVSLDLPLLYSAFLSFSVVYHRSVGITRKGAKLFHYLPLESTSKKLFTPKLRVDCDARGVGDRHPFPHTAPPALRLQVLTISLPDNLLQASRFVSRCLSVSSVSLKCVCYLQPLSYYPQRIGVLARCAATQLLSPLHLTAARLCPRP